MVPSIFLQMEKADNSDGFDSCEDNAQKDSEGLSGNPFQDFNQQILEIEDENIASKLYCLFLNLQ